MPIAKNHYPRHPFYFFTYCTVFHFAPDETVVTLIKISSSGAFSLFAVFSTIMLPLRGNCSGDLFLRTAYLFLLLPLPLPPFFTVTQSPCPLPRLCQVSPNYPIIHYSKFDIGYSFNSLPFLSPGLLFSPSPSLPCEIHFRRNACGRSDAKLFHRVPPSPLSALLSALCALLHAPCFPYLSTPTSVGPTQAVGRISPLLNLNLSLNLYSFTDSAPPSHTTAGRQVFHTLAGLFPAEYNSALQ